MWRPVAALPARSSAPRGARTPAGCGAHVSTRATSSPARSWPASADELVAPLPASQAARLLGSAHSRAAWGLRDSSGPRTRRRRDCYGPRSRPSRGQEPPGRPGMRSSSPGSSVTSLVGHVPYSVTSLFGHVPSSVTSPRRSRPSAITCSRACTRGWAPRRAWAGATPASPVSRSAHVPYAIVLLLSKRVHIFSWCHARKSRVQVT